MRTHLFFLGILFLIGENIFSQSDTCEFSWPEGIKAAVCLTYDDGLDCHLDNAVPALNKYHLKATFYPKGSSGSLQNRMDEWKKICEQGHELGNHSLFHPCNGKKHSFVLPEYDITEYSMNRIRKELYTANTILKAIDGKGERTYAYTCNDYRIKGNISFADSISDMFVAARSSGPIPDDPGKIDFYLVPAQGVTEFSGEKLISLVEQAIEKGSFTVMVFHSIGGGYLNVSDEAHETLLKYLDENRDIVWTDSFIRIMKYIKEEKK